MKRSLLLPIIFGLTLFTLSPPPVHSDSYSGDVDNTASLISFFPPATGWSAVNLDRIVGLASSLGSTSLIVVHRGKLVLEWGKTAKRTSSHSVRKSLINGLIGIAVDKGLIDLNSTIGDLGIVDWMPLTEVEKKATVQNLLMAKSGVYLPAAAESTGMKKLRPMRHSHLPGAYFYYNNWDFNVLGTIFRRAANLSIGKAFEQWIAGPLGMMDFRAGDVRINYELVSQHPSYPFYISARDLALFGQLYLNQGSWEGKRIIPADWIRQSTSPYWFDGERGYGYLWWTYLDLAFYADGFGGQYVVVVPSRNLVVVNRVDSGRPGQERRDWFRSGDKVHPREMLKILEAILAAAPD